MSSKIPKIISQWASAAGLLTGILFFARCIVDRHTPIREVRHIQNYISELQKGHRP